MASTNKSKKNRPGNKLKPSNFPGSMVHADEQHFISIVCGNSRLHWALHDGSGDDFYPTLFWRTSTAEDIDAKRPDPCTHLDRYLPEVAQEVIYGRNQDLKHNKALAAATSALKRIPALTVYVISTNKEQEQGIEFLFSDIPCNLYKLQAKDFYSVDNGAYKGMGVDRLACLKAATCMYGSPALVIDGGTATTYTSTDSNGKVLGGGICPGVAIKLCALADYTGALPAISHTTVQERIQQAREEKKPISLINTSTQDAIIGGVLRETAFNLSGVVKSWVRKVKPDVDKMKNQPIGPDEKEKINTSLSVVVTGGDGEIIHCLLSKDRSDVIECDLDSPQTDVMKHKHLIHQSVRFLLLEKKESMKEQSQTQDEQLRQEILGQRVAKEFQNQVNKDGDPIYRGSIISIERGDEIDDDLYHVLFDDGDREDLSTVEIFDALKLYIQYAEKKKESNAIRRDYQSKKMTKAEVAVKLLEDHSDLVKARMDKERRKEKDKENSLFAASRTLQEERERKEAETSSIDGPPSKKPKLAPEGEFVGQRIAKYFEVGSTTDLYFGSVDQFVSAKENVENVDLWHVTFDDGDQEDFTRDDVIKARKLYQENAHKDTNEEEDG